MRILVDQDGVLYDMNPVWFALHNAEYGHIHELTPDNVTDWYVGNHCKEYDCPAEIYKYFQENRVWTNGAVLDLDSINITRDWIERDIEVAVITTTPNQIAPNRKLSWLRQHYPHLRDVIITTAGSMKAWIDGDFLVDDRIDNHKGFQGISILYNTPYNQYSDLPRARNWQHVQAIIERGIYLLKDNTFLYFKENPHKIIQRILQQEIDGGLL